MVDSRYAKEIDYVFADIVETVKDRALLDSVYQIIELKRGETFMHKGDIWHKFGFLIKGVYILTCLMIMAVRVLKDSITFRRTILLLTMSLL